MILQNKIVVVTGGATGIGLGIAKELVKNNTVISIDRNREKISALNKILPSVKSIRADVTDPVQTGRAVKEIENEFGRIDILINNAGMGGHYDFTTVSEDELMKTVETEMKTNYMAPIRLTKQALYLLLKGNEPAVVFVSSGLAYMPVAVIASYCATKAAIHSFAMSLRRQLRRTNIKVIEVLPPVVDTDLSKSMKTSKMSTEKFTIDFLAQVARGKTVINIGQSSGLEKISRLSPSVAFAMLNKN
ncbi:MAG: SDR family NAD(P)-dependent oxidoreductase [Bacteroidota bacterium]|jgi:short-subunit dehydrogenase involved in D-alanine esterification of teichoic acids